MADFQIIRRTPRKNMIAEAARSAQEALWKNREYERQQEVDSLSEAKTLAEIEKFNREAEAEDQVRNMIFGGGGMTPSAGINQGADPNENFDPFTGKPNPKRSSMLPSVPKSFKYGGVTFDNPDYISLADQTKIDLAKQRIKNQMNQIPAAEVGRDVLAEESLKSVDDARKILFPKGVPESFDKETAWGANRPFGGLPLLPKVRPDNPLDPTDDLKAQKAQTVNRLLKTALSGRQLIQTGVAARPEETQQLLDAFFPNWQSNPSAAFEGLKQLEDFYTRYRSGLRNRFSGEQASGGLPPSPDAVPAWAKGYPEAYKIGMDNGLNENQIASIFRKRGIYRGT